MKNWKALSLIGLSGLVLAACGDNAETTDTTPATNDTTTETSSVTEDTGVVDNSTTATEDILSLEEVVDIYMGEYPNAQIQKVDYDKDSGDWTYEITGVSENREYEVEINAVSGEIIKVDEDDVDDDAYLAFDTIITPEEAIEIAKTALAEEAAVLEGWELDVDDNRTKYDIEFEGSNRDVKLDAETGEVIEID
ncbi:PepSY domain-containing protein [Jeotgalibaca porci]|uniref:PepSY domain-containing protein n=1 Tax=Jeotgalibaca porci TaxID=1868793 RepID=UPI0035A10754